MAVVVVADTASFGAEDRIAVEYAPDFFALHLASESRLPNVR